MLKDKALENLAAGELLLDRGLPNAAASRYYYAMYQAAVHRLVQRGLVPGKIRSGALEWDHSMVENNATRLDDDWRDRLLYRQMRGLRGEADYGDGAVRSETLAGFRDAIADFVRRLTR